MSCVVLLTNHHTVNPERIGLIESGKIKSSGLLRISRNFMKNMGQFESLITRIYLSIEFIDFHEIYML